MKANLDKNLAPAWVSGKSYSTGEFCLYNKRLYICTTDNSDAEFDNSKWERRNLVDLVSGLNSNLSDVSKMLNKTFIFQVRTSDYKLPLFGQIKKLKFKGAESDRSYILIDQNGTTLATAGTSEVTVDVTDVTWCHFTITNGYSSAVYVTFLE